ncbi:hypothetical protein [Cellulophaga sp. BC115SP]|uniref:hypothetical protein n=1 Tax=Cellulophaga sp. BC115SP TaxID=2683263 RepID=UPI0014137389|nr:hypothetical protein [Cellulophaga sp. BC115SP]NBB32003.1 hypothetical protein [Cellulophaga sp. BC115SP]
MKYANYLLLSILVLISNLSNSQNIKLSDIKGIWKSGVYGNNYIVFYKDSIAWVGLIDSKEVALNGFGKVGFIDENDSYLMHLDSVQNTNSDISYAKSRFLRVNLEEDDIKYLNIKNEGSINSIFYFNGILSKLGIEEFPVQIGTRMEIINSNVHIYKKEKDFPPMIISKLIFQFSPILLNQLFDKKIKKITINKSKIYNSPYVPSKMYLIKNDPIEIIEEKNGWLKIRYYPEKNGEWIGKTIEGWIKRSDVE